WFFRQLGFFWHCPQDQVEWEISLRLGVIRFHRLQGAQVSDYRLDIFTVELAELVIGHDGKNRVPVPVHPGGYQPEKLAVRPVAHAERRDIGRYKAAGKAHRLVKNIPTDKLGTGVRRT